MPIPESRQLDFEEIPIVDISQLADPDHAGEIILAIDQACKNVGCAASSKASSTSIPRYLTVLSIFL